MNKYNCKNKHYARWKAMRYRCSNPNDSSYINYGARGITVCYEWQKREPFLKWCEETYISGRTLDRINNNGPYSPDNCKWSTAGEQCSNRRITPKRLEANKISIAKAVRANIIRMRKKYGDIKNRKSKFCSNCGSKRLLKNFGKDSYKPDKLTTYCRSCCRIKCSLSYYKRKLNE